jgi:hypothetical protein
VIKVCFLVRSKFVFRNTHNNNKILDGSLSFPELVWGMFDVGPGDIDEKIECM